ncbi:hypothetical protein Droror1_Dr00019633, partial [Drosera rotundifolia]
MDWSIGVDGGAMVVRVVAAANNGLGFSVEGGAAVCWVVAGNAAFHGGDAAGK